MAMSDGARGRRTGAPLPVSLHELLAAVGPHTAPLGADEPAASESGGAPETDAYLSVTLRGVRCLLPLERLRGVLAERPHVVRVPFAPRWLLGVFPYRAELLALVDPAPVLFGDEEAARAPSVEGARKASGRGQRGATGMVVVVGSDERSLGWLVERAGELATGDAGRTPGTTSGGLRIAEAYMADKPASGATMDAAPVLDMDAALDALLAGLAEAEEDGHE